METEINQVKGCLKGIFQSASDIFVDPQTKECEVKISIDDYQGEINHHLIENNIKLLMVDYCDVYPFKYVFSYRKMGV